MPFEGFTFLLMKTTGLSAGCSMVYHLIPHDGRVKWSGFSQSQLLQRVVGPTGVIRSVSPCSARRAIRGVSWGPKTIPGISWKRPTSVSTTRPLAFIDFIYI